MSTPPLSPLGMDHIVLRCVDLQPMLDFYEGVLGLSLARVNEPLGLYHLRAGTALIDLVVVGGKIGGDQPPDRQRPNMAHFCLRVRDPDWPSLLEHLRSHGLEPGEPGRRFGADGTGPSIYIQDPEGNVVELKGEPVPES